MTAVKAQPCQARDSNGWKCYGTGSPHRHAFMSQPWPAYPEWSK